jgi:hypothetical protein
LGVYRDKKVVGVFVRFRAPLLVLRGVGRRAGRMHTVKELVGVSGLLSIFEVVMSLLVKSVSVLSTSSLEIPVGDICVGKSVVSAKGLFRFLFYYYGWTPHTESQKPISELLSPFLCIIILFYFTSII